MKVSLGMIKPGGRVSTDAPVFPIDAGALRDAMAAFLAEGDSLTIRKGKATGEANFTARMTAAIAAYERTRTRQQLAAATGGTVA